MGQAYKGARQFQDLFGEAIPFTASVNFADTATAGEDAVDVTVTGAALGDFVLLAPSIDVADAVLSAQVTAADTVTVSLVNVTGGNVNLAAQTIYGVVLKKGGAFGGL